MGLQVSDLVLCGYPPVLIPQYAEEWGADLVIAGSHGAGGLARFLLGSVAKSVLQTTQCSVEIFRLRAGRENGAQMKILLATDGSAYSEQAARAIAERPWPKGTIVKVLGVVELPPAGVEPWNAQAWVIDSLREERTKNAGDSVNQAESIVASAGLKTLTEVVAGHARITIIDKAKEWDADLIALGSHGRRGFKRLVLGSVAETVALHAHCSVEVIRRRDGSQQETHQPT
jgi:nucleotide-binding universal stress UspA family protein